MRGWLKAVLGAARRYLWAPVTLGLVAAISGVFPFQRMSGLWWRDVDHLRRALAYSAREIAGGQWWRLLTVNLVHDPVGPELGTPGLYHLLNTVVVLLAVGPALEHR